MNTASRTQFDRALDALAPLAGVLLMVFAARLYAGGALALRQFAFLEFALGALVVGDVRVTMLRRAIARRTALDEEIRPDR